MSSSNTAKLRLGGKSWVDFRSHSVLLNALNENKQKTSYTMHTCAAGGGIPGIYRRLLC